MFIHCEPKSKNLIILKQHCGRPLLVLHCTEKRLRRLEALFVGNKKVIHLYNRPRFNEHFRALTASCWRCLWCPLVWQRQAAWLARRRTSQSRSSGPAPRGSEPPLRGSAGWLGLRGWLGWYCHGWAGPGQGGIQGKRPTLTMRREEKTTDVDSHVHYMGGWKSHSWGGHVGMQVKSQRATVFDRRGGNRSVIKELYVVFCFVETWGCDPGRENYSLWHYLKNNLQLTHKMQFNRT